MSLPQASTVHLRGQAADLSWRALAGFVGQLDGRETRLVIKKQMWEEEKNLSSSQVLKDVFSDPRSSYTLFKLISVDSVLYTPACL